MSHDERLSRAAHLQNFADQRAEGRALIGAGVGIGLSARCAEIAGVDLLVVYNAGPARMDARPSLYGGLSFGSANTTVVEMADQILRVVDHTPVLAGVWGADPYANIPGLLRHLRDLGYAGVQNFPTVALHDGSLRREEEESGFGFGEEVAMIAQAHDLDLLTATYVRTVEETIAMTRAGADILVPHVGLTTSGLVGAQTSVTLDGAVAHIQALYDAATAIRPDVLVVCHGGPLATPDDVAYVLDRIPGLAGFLGASSMERIPVETALVQTMKAFKQLTVTPAPDAPVAATQEVS